MKIKHIFFLFGIIIVILSVLFACNRTKERHQQSLMEISKQELISALQERDELLALVKEVAAGLEQIKRLDMSIEASRYAKDADRKAKILADISALKELMQRRKEQLQQLETRLRNSTINNKEFQETIHALRVQIDAQIEEIESLKHLLTVATERIDVLNNAVDTLNSAVSTVTGERNAAQKASVQLEDELNRCYYVVATRSELKAHNIIASGLFRRGGLMAGNFDKWCFVVSDKRQLDTLPLNSTKAKILTNHPEGSYQLIDGDGQKLLNITNPHLFWSLTNHLVVQSN